jgi:putative transposase
LPAERKRGLVDEDHPELSIQRQCELIGLARSSFYYQPAAETATNLDLMRLIDEVYTAHPYFGVRRMWAWLRRLGHEVNRKRVARLMGKLGLQAIYPKPRLSDPDKQHLKYPYLLRDVEINRLDQVWSTDITYIRLEKGFVYLAAVIDWHSRYVLSWAVSISLEAEFCVDALKAALVKGKPEVFNTDQGSQFTSEAFTGCLLEEGIQISMDGKGRAIDNVFVERLWRAVKYEEVYLRDYRSVREAKNGLARYFEFYNNERPHQSLGYRTPREAYFARTVECQGIVPDTIPA